MFGLGSTGVKAARGALLLGSLATLGCGIEFDPVSEVTGLRVLAVQKSAPYAEPGEDVQLDMLWTDAEDRQPQIVWFSGCFNPPGDFYYGCFPQLAALGEAFAGFQPGQPLPDLPEGFGFGTGNSFTFTMPSEVISSRPPPPDKSQPPYGLAYVFFAVCAGELGPAPQTGEPGFPIACYDGNGKQLGPNDFVAGYSSVYAYEGFRNANPIVTGFTFNGVEVEPGCIDEECLQPQPEPVCSGGTDVACIDRCTEEDDEQCPPFPVKPLVDRASVEIDEVRAGGVAKPFQEQMWIRYFTDGGHLKSPVRLLNDATKGWNDDYGTEYRAPSEPGSYDIWAVVQDNRGGAAWVRVPVVVR